ncbi:MAG: DinB family protein [Humibacillus sp.]|nr:DinB family protein [Humibacillus sp.]MDN5776820.1 DinB family protein [Humibacillus sp.]
MAGYVEERERLRRAIADADLDDGARGEGMDFSLRYAMIRETAPHCGHLDLLREATEGPSADSRRSLPASNALACRL